MSDARIGLCIGAAAAFVLVWPLWLAAIVAISQNLEHLASGVLAPVFLLLLFVALGVAVTRTRR